MADTATERVDVLVAGAGITGLGAAAFLAELAPSRRAVVIERDSTPGGYCRTVKRDGFTWDYAGHFFHFRDPAMDAWVHRNIRADQVATVVRNAKIRYGAVEVDFPFQRHIHQLPRRDFLACLTDLYHERVMPTGGSFFDLMVANYGRAIAERFLIPYNQKLYACDLRDLDASAMGRFFPHTSFADVMAQIASDTQATIGYNATFRYPRGGAETYVQALASRLPADAVACDEALVSVDVERRVATTTKRRFAYQRLISSLPLPVLARACGVPFDRAVFTANRVLVFNLGFDRKGRPDLHWLYVPDPAFSFYRVGWYDNIFGDDRMSIYVEIGLPGGAENDAAIDIEGWRRRVLADLADLGLTSGHRLVAHHSVVLDPAYVHITDASLAETKRLREQLMTHGIYSAGRYGAWTYCSIEDNLLEAKAVAAAVADGGA